MAEKIDDGGAAFPYGNPTAEWDFGMSLRDWFAGQAMAGIQCATALLFHSNGPSYGDEDVAGMCYALADAMLAERKKGAE